MPKMKNGQITLSGVGEWYMDRLTIDAWINSRSVGFQASSLLCAKVQELESRIQERLAYLAKKRKISVEELSCRASKLHVRADGKIEQPTTGERFSLDGNFGPCNLNASQLRRTDS